MLMVLVMTAWNSGQNYRIMWLKGTTSITDLSRAAVLESKCVSVEVRLLCRCLARSPQRPLSGRFPKWSPWFQEHLEPPAEQPEWPTVCEVQLWAADGADILELGTRHDDSSSSGPWRNPLPVMVTFLCVNTLVWPSPTGHVFKMTVWIHLTNSMSQLLSWKWANGSDGPLSKISHF